MLCRRMLEDTAPLVLNNPCWPRVCTVACLGYRSQRALVNAASLPTLIPFVKNAAFRPHIHSLHPRRENLSTQASAAGSREARAKRTNSIIVGLLASDITATQLEAAFLSCGRIVRTNIEQRYIEGEPLGYGIVKFGDRRSVDAALTLDQSVVGGHVVYVRAIAQRLDQVVISGLRWDVDEHQLKAMFEKCGAIKDFTTRSAGRRDRVRIGFLTFSSPDSVRRSLELTGTELNGRSITVARAYTYSETKREISHAAKRTFTQILVENLPPQVDDEWLESEFEQCGEIESARIMRDLSTHEAHGTGNSLGFGYVTFFSRAAVDKALELDGRLTISGQPARIQMAPRSVPTNLRHRNVALDGSRPTIIWVSRLTHDLHDASLFKEFQRFGEVTEVRIMRHRESRISRGFGYVTFASADSSEKALAQDGKMKINGFTIKIQAAKSKE